MLLTIRNVVCYIYPCLNVHTHTANFLDLELLREDETHLWWAGKELLGDKRLSDCVGSNEKTKVALFSDYLKPFILRGNL